MQLTSLLANFSMWRIVLQIDGLIESLSGMMLKLHSVTKNTQMLLKKTSPRRHTFMVAQAFFEMGFCWLVPMLCILEGEN